MTGKIASAIHALKVKFDRELYVAPIAILLLFVGLTSFSITSTINSFRDQVKWEHIGICETLSITFGYYASKGDLVILQRAIDAISEQDKRIFRLSFIGKKSDGKYYHLTSSWPSRIGTLAHQEDLDVIRNGTPIILEEMKKGKSYYDFTYPIRDDDGIIIGSLGYTAINKLPFNWLHIGLYFSLSVVLFIAMLFYFIRRAKSMAQLLNESKEAEKVLKNSEENLRITLNSIGDAVITTNVEGIITNLNPVAEGLTGWSFTEAEKKPLTDIFQIINEETNEIVQNPVKLVIEARKPVELSNASKLIAKNGNEYLITDSGAPIFDLEGNITGIVVVFRDVTEKHKIEQERLNISKLEAIGLLAGGIAHDFNNLLTGLFGNIELAKKFLSTGHKSQKYIESAERSMEMATSLTKQLLTFSKGGDPMKESLFIGETIIEMAEFSLRGSNVKLQKDVASDLWPVEVDKGQLNQVISNLTINAQQAMPSGGTISISATNIEIEKDRYVQITVHDEGEGIPSQLLEKIFDPYFTTKEKGHGLGLASVYSIVHKHNGLIMVDSIVGQGTDFTVRLLAIDDQCTRALEATKEIKYMPTPARILIMDDEEVILEVLGEILTTFGHKADFATDGKEAITKYKISYEEGNPYDLVITDLTVPGGMGGEAAAEGIAKIDSEAKVIVSSGYSNSPVMANYQAYGFKARVQKPYNIDELKKAITLVLKGST